MPALRKESRNVIKLDGSPGKKDNKGKRVILAIKNPAWGDDPLRGTGMLHEK